MRRWTTLATTLTLAATSPAATQVLPPAGYSFAPAVPRPAIALDPEPGAPALTRVPDASLARLLLVDRGYSRATEASVKVVGAFAIAEPAGGRLIEAWSPGFLPIALRFSDGRCFSLSADYENGTLGDGRLRRTACDARRGTERAPPPAPVAMGLRLVGVSWGFAAWVDDRARTTIVTVLGARTFVPLFSAHLRVEAALAMNSPDAPLANVTLVGRIRGRLTVVVLAVAY